MFELSKQFRFEAAHTLQRSVDAEASRRIHGHSYRAEVAVRGTPDATTGMVVDLGLFERALASARAELEHQFLDEVADLGPATMENLCTWIWRKVAPVCGGVVRVTVYRDGTGDVCSYFGADGEVK